jgi:putative SOS response-associated peptidase YedK
MAGLYRYNSDADGTPKPRFVILTTVRMRILRLHDRIPVILARTRGKPGSTETTSGTLLSRTGPESRWRGM